MTRPTTTDITDRVAEDLVIVFDYLSRILAAAEEGSPLYLHEKTYQLAGAARGLHNLLSTEPYRENSAEYRQLDERKRFDPVRLRALLTEHGRHHRVGRALYPLGGDTNAAVAQHTLERAATELRYGAAALRAGAAGLTEPQADRVADWLREQAPKRAVSP